MSRFAADARLTIVGDGPERDALVEQIADLGMTDAITIHPGTFDAPTIDALYARAVAAACGGYVGLNITQSLTRGVPFVYPMKANHSPEVSLAHDGVNAFAFRRNTPDSVAEALARVWRTPVDHAAIADADDLEVSAPVDDGVQRWSTDPRSRVPALPRLDDGAASPRCLQTVHRGVTLFGELHA